MAALRLVLSMFVLLLAVVSLSEGLRGIGPKKCCVRFNDKPPIKENVVSYIQTSQQCSKSGVLLKMKSGRQLCYRPSATWVRELIDELDNKVLPGEMSNL
ncbi:C-C motif chemokine 3-like [Cynoglossus semilaevis]|uniref:C-C motif chemokine 3-like n=1 Tax=Cynoglossus semilaevis TaxID=244447 RepID=A0A3P8UMU8_CYNSE|nr:C-C motif chemokine 3-like [Cynoglossus semilaevis]